MDDEGSDPSGVHGLDSESKELLGMFDVPAFARRGVDVEYALGRVHGRCVREREGRLAMVRVRLKEWAEASVGPDDWADCFASSPTPIFAAADLHGETTWAAHRAAHRRRRAAAKNLASAVARFNREWRAFLEAFNLEPFNRVIDDFNRYYVLEKECVVGSSRLASRFFTPKPPLTVDSLLARYPALPEVALRC